MYESFFKLSETPFSIAPNPHYLYMSQQHNEALAHLVYGVGRDGGVVLLTGEVGTGKTTVCRCFLEQIPDDTDVAFVLNPKLQVDELLATICDELSIPYIGDSISIKDYIDCINSFLLRQHASGRHTVLIIDEAQNLSSDVLEQIRLLTNLETHEKKLLQIVLLGQPELQDMFRQPELRQLSQRVTARFHLKALQEHEVGPYVYHRLSVAGAVDPRAMFSAPVIKRLFQISQGIPRIINLVCDRSMLGAYAKESRVIDLEVLHHAASEVLGYEIHSPAQTMKRRWIPAAIGVLAGVLMMGAYTFFERGPSEEISMSDTRPLVEEAIPKSVLVPELALKAGDTLPAPPSIPKLPESVSAEAKVGVETTSNITTQTTPSLLSMAEVFTGSSHRTEADAYMDLFSAWGIEYDSANDAAACNYAEARGLACLTKLGSLGSMKHLGLPAILRLVNDQGEQKYIAVRRLEDTVAEVYLNAEVRKVDLSNLDDFWRGYYSVLWKKPPNYHGPLHPGTIAPLSKWLSYQLDIWEKKPSPAMGRSSYDEELVARVKSFQRYVGESDDGIVGASTLIQLFRLTDDQIPLLTTKSGGS